MVAKKKETKKVTKKSTKKVTTKKTVAKKTACKSTPKCNCKVQKVSVKTATPAVTTPAKKSFWTKVKEFFGF